MDHINPAPPQSSQRKGLRSCLALVAVGCLGLAASCSSSGPRKPGDGLGLSKAEKIEMFFETATRHIEMGDINRAQSQAKKGLEIDPGNPRFLLIYGRCALQRDTAQDIAVAIDTFERIKGKSQQDFRVQASWGMAVERLGDFHLEAAEGVRSGTRTTEAADPAVRANELEAKAEEYWKEAREHFKASLAARSGEPEAINGLVRTSALLGEKAESIAYARELIKSIGSSQRLVAQGLEETEITAREEERLFESKVSNRDFEVKTRLHIATLLRSEGKLGEAIAELDEIILLAPDMAQAHSLKGQLLFEQKDYVRARASVTRFIEMKAPNSEVTNPEIMRAFDLREKCERALQAAR